MSCAGVDSRHAEQLLGHTIKGVEGIYDRHAYTAEKAEAARKLAGLLALILGFADGQRAPNTAGRT